MPESAAHQFLVQQLVRWISINCLDSKNSVLLVDEPTRTAIDKPPNLSGYTPDVYWKSLDGSRVIVGEAKSAYDVESRHSRRQYESFLLHLSRANSGTLLIAVPWHVVNQAKSLVRVIQRGSGFANVQTVFLDQLPG